MASTGFFNDACSDSIPTVMQVMVKSSTAEPAKTNHSISLIQIIREILTIRLRTITSLLP